MSRPAVETVISVHLKKKNREPCYAVNTISISLKVRVNVGHSIYFLTFSGADTVNVSTPTEIWQLIRPIVKVTA